MSARREVLEDGNEMIVDPYRGIGLVIEPTARPLLWIVISMFRRFDNGQAGEPNKIEYGKN